MKYFNLSSLEIQGPGYLSRYSDSLRSGRSGDRILVGLSFAAPAQSGPGPNPVPLYIEHWVVLEGTEAGTWR
jgi:hypothetical protein